MKKNKEKSRRTRINADFVSLNSDLQIQDRGILPSKSVGIVQKRVGENMLEVYFIVLGEKLTVESKLVTLFDVHEAGDAFKYKICNVCHRLLKTSVFAKNQNGKGNRPIRRPSCTDCRETLEGRDMNKKEREVWEKNHPLPYGVPFVCPLCNKRTIAGVTSKIVLDHNHLTGKPRGWICDSCNTGIGRFKDDPKIIERAIHYIKT